MRCALGGARATSTCRQPRLPPKLAGLPPQAPGRVVTHRPRQHAPHDGEGVRLPRVDGWPEAAGVVADLLEAPVRGPQVVALRLGPWHAPHHSSAFHQVGTKQEQKAVFGCLQSSMPWRLGRVHMLHACGPRASGARATHLHSTLSCFFGDSCMHAYSLRTASLFSRSHTTAGSESVGMMPTCP
jgi:hypothetical protein